MLELVRVFSFDYFSAHEKVWKRKSKSYSGPWQIRKNMELWPSGIRRQALDPMVVS